MAKAANPSSTMIWLLDALKEAKKVFGSRELAEERLLKSLATGQLPWTCESWEELDETGERRRTDMRAWTETGSVLSESLGFWSDPCLSINWEDNSARQRRSHGAAALGIQVSRHLYGVLPEKRDYGVLPEKRDRTTKVGPQMRRVRQALKKLYPPHGEVPDGVSIEAVRARVDEELAPESRNRGLAAPSWDTVRRALGRV